jgi:diguanylate cyclase (GGDEF)-like protein
LSSHLPPEPPAPGYPGAAPVGLPDPGTTQPPPPTAALGPPKPAATRSAASFPAQSFDVTGGSIIMVPKRTAFGSKMWSKVWSKLWRPPDPDLVDAGLQGEWLIAGLRLLIVLSFLAFPLQQFTQYGAVDRERWTVPVWMAIGGLAEALVLYSAVMRSWGRNWISFFSGMIDVSLVTSGLWIFVLLDRPLEATADTFVFSIYLLAIGATSLRYDWRVSFLTGVTAMVQYSALTFFAFWRWRLDQEAAGGTDFEVDWLSQVARLLLLGMATALATTIILRAHEQRRRSNRDRLTNLANRGFFDESLARLAALAARSGEVVTIAMLDVDHFKRFNDTYGHLAGDSALRAVAEILASSFRTTDLVARYGGEEFAGLFPGMGLDDAARRLEALRSRIERMTIRVDGGKLAKVTISVGVAIWPEDGQELKDVLSLADFRLYQAKHTGRNRLVTTTDSGHLHILPSHPHAAKRRPAN